MHHQDAAQTLIAVLVGVVHSGACGAGTGVYAEEGQLTHIGVGHDLEGQSGERLVIRGRSLFLFLGLGIDTLDVRNVHRRGHIVHNGIQQLLNALVLIAGTADHRNHMVVQGRLTDDALDVRYGEFLTVQIFHHQLFIQLSHRLQELGTILFGLLLHVLGNFLHPDVLAQIVIVDVSLHLHQIDDTLKGILTADGQLEGNRVALQTVADHVQNVVEIGAHNVHLVDIDHSGDLVLVGLTPHSLGLRLNAALGAQNGNGAVQHTQGTLDLNGEVHVTGGINDVDAMAVFLRQRGIILIFGVAPIAGSSSGGNGDTSLLLLCHPVHLCGTIVSFTDLVGLAGVVEDTFCSCGFTRIDVSHNADITSHLERYFSWHIALLT